MMNSFNLNFIGIGAERSATTWIAEALREHPQICLAHPKEIDFFGSQKYQLGLDWYSKHFFAKSGKQVFGEFTSTYLYSASTAQRIKEHFPDVKIIVSLRQPVDRFISHLLPNLKQEDFQGILENNRHLIKKGFYFQHLTKYLNLFPRENILVMIYDDLQANPVNFLKQIYQFVGVNPDFRPSCLEKRINVKATYRFSRLKKALDALIRFLERSKLGPYLKKVLIKLGFRRVFYAFSKLNEKPAEQQEVPKEIIGQLKSIYREDVQKLRELIKKNLWQDI